MTSARVLRVCLIFVPCAVSGASLSVVAVSPGNESAPALVGSACPTFSWGADTPGRVAFELTVYAVRADGSLASEPTLSERLPRGAASWTPAADRCLAVGSYAWTLRALAEDGDAGAWASPRLFEVADDPLAARLERAVERVLERFIAEGRISVPGSPPHPDPSAAALDGMAPSDATSSASAPPSFVADTALYDPPDCQDGFELFTDVDSTHPLCQFIEQFANDQISPGCTPGPNGRFCPDDAVTRGQLAVYIERAMRGTATWDVNADLLDGLNSTAFLQLTGGNMTGAIDLGNNLLANIGAAGTDFTAGGGLTIAGSVTLGDSVADTATVNAGPLSLPNAINAADALVLGGDVSLFRNGADVLNTPDSLTVGGNVTLGDSSLDSVTVNGAPVNFPNATVASRALVLGGDTNLYRSAADTLRTDDNLLVMGTTTLNGDTTVEFGARLTTFFLLLVPMVSPPVACGGGTRGAIYFDSDDATLCVCESGAAYTPLDGAGACT